MKCSVSHRWGMGQLQLIHCLNSIPREDPSASENSRISSDRTLLGTPKKPFSRDFPAQFRGKQSEAQHQVTFQISDLIVPRKAQQTHHHSSENWASGATLWGTQPRPPQTSLSLLTPKSSKLKPPTFSLFHHPVIDVFPAFFSVLSKGQFFQSCLIELLAGFLEGLQTQTEVGHYSAKFLTTEETSIFS